MNVKHSGDRGVFCKRFVCIVSLNLQRIQVGWRDSRGVQAPVPELSGRVPRVRRHRRTADNALPNTPG